MSKPMGLRTALRFALGITAGAMLLSGGYSHAQEEEEEAKEVEEVIVTGSRIKRSNLDSVKPLEIIDASTIAKTGLNNIGDVLQNITSSDGTGIRARFNLHEWRRRIKRDFTPELRRGSNISAS